MNKRNGWFLASGILSILGSIGVGIGAFAMFILSVTIKSADPSIWNDPSGTLTPQDLAIMSRGFVILGIVLLIVLAGTIFNAVVFMKYSSKSYEEIRQHSGLIITAIVFGFLLDGILVGIFGVLGYVLKPEENNETIIEPASNNTESRLQQLKTMRDNGTITEEEYQQKREEILKSL